jgi:hypothetical protein
MELKPDISTLLKTGHFHVALTRIFVPLLEQSDKFLL